jgi:hypothetical protein
MLAELNGEQRLADSKKYKKLSTNKERTTLALTDNHNMKHIKMIPKNFSGKVEMRMEICPDLV